MPRGVFLPSAPVKMKPRSAPLPRSQAQAISGYAPRIHLPYYRRAITRRSCLQVGSSGELVAEGEGHLEGVVVVEAVVVGQDERGHGHVEGAQVHERLAGAESPQPHRAVVIAAVVRRRLQPASSASAATPAVAASPIVTPAHRAAAERCGLPLREEPREILVGEVCGEAPHPQRARGRHQIRLFGRSVGQSVGWLVGELVSS